jgi:hypothetical protein
MLETNEFKIRLSGTANIPKGLDLSKTYDLTISNAEVRSSESIPNDDGTCNIVHKLTISELSEVNLIGANEVIKAKKKGSQAKVVRFLLEKIAEKKDKETEPYYQERMNSLITTLQAELNDE